MNNRFLHNQKGLTLVEIVAAIIIISIIFLSFITFLYQSQKTTNAAEQTVSATYIAQEHLEEVYSISKQIPFQQLKLYYQPQTNFQLIKDTASELNIRFDDINPTYTIDITFTKLSHASVEIAASPTSLNLYTVMVSVYENGVLKNTVETIYQFN
jgi:prepilin-type N-terminal cleavage/methylation domain-containing protein